MLTYNSNRDKKIDFNVGGVKNVRTNIDKGKEVVSNIKKDGLVTGVKRTFNNNNNNTTSVSDKVSSAINKYKSTISSSYEMETEDLQQKVTNVLDKGSKFMNTTRVGRVLKKVFGPSNPNNKGSDYTPDGKVPRK